MKKIAIYNSKTSKLEDFRPNQPGKVSMYCCGITTYDHTHLGHIRKYLGDDIIKRVLKLNGYKVNHVQNITDVGHLTSDADEGEDKLEVGAKKHNLSVLEVARKFEKEFYDTMSKMNITKADIVERAADDSAIEKQLEIIQDLVDKDIAYVTEFAIYFDTSKVDNYNPFSNQSIEDKLQNARGDVFADKTKRNMSDFVLWVFKKGKHKNHSMEWDSPWGAGFPGWHIECSAISLKNLGEYIDIHTGGIDHKEIHHPNEIAQNQAYLGHSAVNYWVHHNFLIVDGEKMSKSKNNFYTLQDIVEKGYGPMALKYYLYTAHYRKQLNLTDQGLEGAATAYNRLLKRVASMNLNEQLNLEKVEKYKSDFREVVNDDFNMPDALAVLWNTVSTDELNGSEKRDLISYYDQVFGLQISEKSKYIDNSVVKIDELPEDILSIVNYRAEARENNDYDLSDKLRDKLFEKGYEIKDLPNNEFTIKKI